MNKKCLIVINKTSGNSKNIDIQKVTDTFASGFDVTYDFIDGINFEWKIQNIDKLIVCGGDGTLNNALNVCQNTNIDIIYCPFGTFNEMSKNNNQNLNSFELKHSGKMNDRLFSYVSAAGTFTPLGYTVSNENKQKFKIFAYFSKVIKEYKVNCIKADLQTESQNFNGTYTLIMIVDSKRCFGFKFNYLYNINNEELYLLLIKSPGKNNLINKIKIFFPFFRAFFIGFRKPIQTKKMAFIPFKKLNINLENPQKFCVDGEEIESKQNIEYSKFDISSKVTIIPRQKLKKLLKKT